MKYHEFGLGGREDHHFNVPLLLVLVKHLNADGFFLPIEAINFDLLQVRGAGPVSNSDMRTGGQHADVLNLVSIIWVRPNLPAKLTKVISGRSIDFLAKALPTGKATLV